MLEIYVLVSKEKSLFIKTTALACFVIGAMSTLYVIMGYLIFFPMAVIAWGIAFFLHTRKYEYEYSYYDGELRFAKIINKKKRKELKGYAMEEVIAIAPIDDRSIQQYVNDKNNKIRNLTTGNPQAKVYAAVVKNGNEIELVTYEPDEKYLNEVCVKYGHKVKR